MEFQEIDSKGIIKIERLATLTVSAGYYEGRVVFITTPTNKMYFGTGSEWVETMTSLSLSAHEMSTNHPSASVSASGFITTQLPNDATYYYNGEGEWTKVTIESANIQIEGTWDIGDVLRMDTSGNYVKANSTSEANAEVIGIVSITTNTLITNGYVSGLDTKYGSLSAGSVYYLSETDGNLTTTEPVTPGYISKPLLIAISESEGIFFNWRGLVVSSGTTSSLPPGTIIAWPSETVPDGYLECVGTWLSTITYADLFAVIGYAYGGSSGTFYLPDYRGAFLRAFDNGRGVDPGRVLGTYQADAFASHTHTVSSVLAAPGPYDALQLTGDPECQFSTVTSSSTGDTETRPKNYAVKYLIKY